MDAATEKIKREMMEAAARKQQAEKKPETKPEPKQIEPVKEVEPVKEAEPVKEVKPVSVTSVEVEPPKPAFHASDGGVAVEVPQACIKCGGNALVMHSSDGWVVECRKGCWKTEAHSDRTGAVSSWNQL